jgi:fatty acid desaturase
MYIFTGLIIIAGGIFLVLKTEWFINNFGRIAWFEAKLGTEGGSRLGYKLVGIFLIFLGVIVMTGSSSEFMSWMLSPLLKYQK